MNINLATVMDPDDGDGSLQDAIDEHQEILGRAGYTIYGTAILIPDEEYKGAYQVWSPIIHTTPGTPIPTYVWIDPDGVEHIDGNPTGVDIIGNE